MDILLSTVILIALGYAFLRAPYLIRDYILFENELTLWFAKKAQYFAWLIGETVTRDGATFTIDGQHYILHTSCIDFGMLFFISVCILALFTAIRGWRLSRWSYLLWFISIFASIIFMNTVRMGVQLYLIANNPDLLLVGYSIFELELVVTYIMFTALLWSIIGLVINITD